MLEELMEIFGNTLHVNVFAKYDVHRREKKWTVIVGDKRLGDFDDPVGPLIKIMEDHDIKEWYEVFRRQV